jgi:hypothetical protein
MVDTFISAQLPNPTSDPIGYEVVSSFLENGFAQYARPNNRVVVKKRN